jgi:energy-coupling factor transporter ATP-binding protein EcfA2
MLHRVRIKNFRSCEDTLIDNIGQLVALVGHNGAGKSNILVAISIVSKSATSASQLDTLKVLIRRIHDDQSLRVLAKDYSGCGEILKRGANQLQSFANQGCTKFIVCHDADGPDPLRKHREIESRVVRPSGCEQCCIVIPVHEIEAWILADIDNVAKHVSKYWNPPAFEGNPEGVEKPQKVLENMSRNSKKMPRYSHTSDNEVVARHLDLARVRSRCPSFRPFIDFVRG